MMYRRNLLAVVAAALLAGCATYASSGGAPNASAKRQEINASVDRALADLYAKAPGSRQLVAKARGVLVLPEVTSAGFVVGASYGEGALRESGKTSAYYSVAAGSVGLLAGAQQRSLYMLFMTDDALRKFEASDKWTAGADASVAMINAGADARVDLQTAQSPVIGYVLDNKGLMANLSVDGTKFTKMNL